MKKISIVYPYYENPGMLEIQYGIWSSYPEFLKRKIEIVLVDDGSPNSPAIQIPRPTGLPKLRIYRVLIDKPWHQHGARNLGASVADGPWLLLTDMDHVIPEQSLEKVLLHRNRNKVYTFGRLDAPDLTPTLDREGNVKPHPNSFAMTKELYWRVGGYDEDYCGVYGTDGLFRSRLYHAAKECHIAAAYLVRYSRDVIPDASTTSLLRKEGRPPNAKSDILIQKMQAGRGSKITTLNFEWERAL